MMARHLVEVRRIEKFFDGLKFGISHVWTTAIQII
jgi:hypothetical protein